MRMSVQAFSTLQHKKKYLLIHYKKILKVGYIQIMHLFLYRTNRLQPNSKAQPGLANFIHSFTSNILIVLNYFARLDRPTNN